MARSNFNVVTHGLSGLVGDMLVFRQKAGRTIVARKPRPSSKPITAVAMAIRDRFKRATAYALSVMGDPTLKAEYQLTAKLGQSAFNKAFSDYQKAPEIYEDINLATYTGAIGEQILVSVIDDFRVAGVRVQIKTPDGSILETGEAVQAVNGLDWVYTTISENPDVSGIQVIITARDLPGNETVLEKVMM